MDTRSSQYVDFGLQLHRRAIDSLSEEFAGVFSRATIERYVRETQDELDEVQYGPGMSFHRARIDWFARARLEELVAAKRQIQNLEPAALFVCVQNAGRSQMAAALASRLSNGWVHVHSVGSRPATALDRNVVRAMDELGIDLSPAYPKPLTDEAVRAADLVVTMGCDDSCPVYPGKHYEDWAVADPSGQSIEVVRQIRDDVGERVQKLLGSLSLPIAV